MTLRLNGNLDALKKEDDSLPWEQATDNHFVFDGDIADAFQASTVGGGSRTGDAQAYGVIPEPAVSGLILLGAMGMILVRRLFPSMKTA